MSGIYNNETKLYLYDEEYENGQWFEDATGYLYIIPQNNGYEIDGPDGYICDELNRMCRMQKNGIITTVDIERLCLLPIDPVLRRFSEEGGYYHA